LFPIPHPLGTTCVLVGCVLIIVFFGVTTWFSTEPGHVVLRRTFARTVLTFFSSVGSWLVMVPILFRVFDMPSGLHAFGDIAAQMSFDTRGYTVLALLASILLSPVLALVMLALLRDRDPRSGVAMKVGAFWAFGVFTRFVDLEFFPRV
jgi:hypothetical protein